MHDEGGIDAIRSALHATWGRRQEISLSEYVQKHVRLSPHWEVAKGIYDLKENPFWADILDAMQDPYVREISILKSTRVGGTLTLIAALWGLADLDPGVGLIVAPDRISKIELRDRIYDTGLESPAFRHRVPRKRERNERELSFGNMRCFLAQAGSAQQLRGRTCRRVFRTEIDVWPNRVHGMKGGNPILATAERVKRNPYSLIYSESSPSGEESLIAMLYDMGNQMLWHCPCPVCNVFQELRFFPYRAGEHAGNGGIVGFQNDKNEFLSEEEIRSKAHYRCINGCRIDNDRKQSMVREGVWVPKGCSVDSHGKVIGKPEKSRRHISAHLWQVHVPTLSFDDIAADYVNHCINGLRREFHENVLGRRFRRGRRPLEWFTIAKRYASYYERQEVPQDAYFLTAGVDVQRYGCYWSIWAWGHQAKGWLIDWGLCRRFFDSAEIEADKYEDLTYPHVSSDLKQLNSSILNRKLPMIAETLSVHGERHMSVLGLAIDSQYRKHSVHRFIHQLEDDRVISVRGDHKCNPDDRFRLTEVDRDQRTGQRYSQKRKIWGIFTSRYKEELYDKLQLEAGAEGAISFPASMPQDGQDFIRQLTNERLIEEESKDGRKHQSWQPIDKNLGSHYLDTAVYALARAEIILNKLRLTWDQNSWRKTPTPINHPQQQIVREYQAT